METVCIYAIGSFKTIEPSGRVESTFMYFPNGGSTLRGISRPGEIVWSRIYLERSRLAMDIGRGSAIELPYEETKRRWDLTTREWPIMHGVLYGVSRDQFMAQHKANHIQVVCSTNETAADRTLEVKAALADTLGKGVNECGLRCREKGPASSANHLVGITKSDVTGR